VDADADRKAACTWFFWAADGWRRRIELAGSATMRRGPSDSEWRLMAAPADALAEHPDHAVVGQAVADLRELAGAGRDRPLDRLP
jgi:hypothetical protein